MELKIDKSKGDWDRNSNQMDDVAYQLYLNRVLNNGVNIDNVLSQSFIMSFNRKNKGNGCIGIYNSAELVLRSEKILKIRSLKILKIKERTNI